MDFVNWTDHIKAVEKLPFFKAYKIGDFVIHRVPGGYLYGFVNPENGLVQNQSFVDSKTYARDVEKEKTKIQLLEQEINNVKRQIIFSVMGESNSEMFINMFRRIAKEYQYDNKREIMILFFFSEKTKVVDYQVILGDDKSVFVEGAQRHYITNTKFENMVLVHNHPGGDPTQSKNDIASTRWMDILCELNFVNLVDHIIVGKDQYVSFKESGIMPAIKKETEKMMKKWKLINN